MLTMSGVYVSLSVSVFVTQHRESGHTERQTELRRYNTDPK